MNGERNNEEAVAQAQAAAERTYLALVAVLQAAPAEVAFIVAERLDGELRNLHRAIAERLTGDGWSWSEIAQLVGKPKSTITSRLGKPGSS